MLISFMFRPVGRKRFLIEGYALIMRQAPGWVVAYPSQFALRLVRPRKSRWVMKRLRGPPGGTGFVEVKLVEGWKG